MGDNRCRECSHPDPHHASYCGRGSLLTALAAAERALADRTREWEEDRRTINALLVERDSAKAEVERLSDRVRGLEARLAANHRFEQSPCPICDYNGEGYFQPDTHPCAAAYHTAMQRRLKHNTQDEMNACARAALTIAAERVAKEKA